MAELALDVVEQIAVRLDVEDLIRCKSVCKSWQSVISSPSFVKAHLNHAYMNDRNNRELGHRRICLSIVTDEDWRFYNNYIHIVGSCNGLVCVSPIDVKFVVTNPSTREHKKLPTLSYRPRLHTQDIAVNREAACWGFGYDTSADDYKVIVGFMKRRTTLFHVLTLKSNTWKVIGEVKYTSYEGKSGILCDGALHWFMTNKNKKKVIISLDLSTEEFKEITPPYADLSYKRDYYFHTLGVIEECLCIYSCSSPSSTKKWIMKNNNWERYNDDHCQNKYDVAHYLPITWDSQKTSSDCVVDDGTRVPVNGDYIRASIFVKSLVSPHPHVEGQKRNVKGHEDTECVESSAKGIIRKKKRKRSQSSCSKIVESDTNGNKRKRSNRSCKNKKPLI